MSIETGNILFGPTLLVDELDETVSTSLPCEVVLCIETGVRIEEGTDSEVRVVWSDFLVVRDTTVVICCKK